MSEPESNVLTLPTQKNIESRLVAVCCYCDLPIPGVTSVVAICHDWNDSFGELNQYWPCHLECFKAKLHPNAEVFPA